jgi:hypothetical protein
MNQKITKNLFLGGLVVAGLALGSFEAKADNVNQQSANSAKMMSSEKFYSILEKTKPNQLATNFGTPDNIVSLRNAKGAVTGVVWVYHDAVLKGQAKMNANFMVVNGEFVYVSLSQAS